MQDQFRIAVCDDERGDLERMQEMVRTLLTEEGVPFEVTGFLSGKALLDVLREDSGRFQLVLLDVLMEGLDGVSLARELGAFARRPEVVLVSTNRDFALVGYEVSVVRFLEKPVDAERLREALLHVYRFRLRREKVIVRTADGLRRIPVETLRYVETRGRGSRLFLDSGPVDAANSLQELEAALGNAGFYRCHQSFLICLGCVELIRRYEVTLQGGIRLPVSKSRYNETRRALTLYASL